MCVWCVYTSVGTFVCVCMCVYYCLGSQRVTEAEFDEGTAVVSKGGLGLFLSFTCRFSAACTSVLGVICNYSF